MDTTDQTQKRVTTAIAAVTSAFADIPDSAERAQAVSAMLAAVPDLQSDLGIIRRDAVRDLRAEAGYSHADVGKLLGISRSRAQAIAEGRTESARVRNRDDKKDG